MVDALPYLVDYPYGCTEQTLNRFLPTVITQKVLIGMNLDLKDIEKKAHEPERPGNRRRPKRAADWKRNNPPNPGVKDRNPVFDMDTVTEMTKDGVNKLTNMQLSDGGWGWFSGFGEQSYPHTTALVVHGLQIAKQNDVALVPGVLERGWNGSSISSRAGEDDQERAEQNPAVEGSRRRSRFARLHGPDRCEGPKRRHEGHGRIPLSRPHATQRLRQRHVRPGPVHNKEKPKLDMILQNISQYVVQDNENQTAYLKLPDEQLLVGLVWQRHRGDGVLPETAQPYRSQGRGRVADVPSISSTTASMPPTGTARATRRLVIEALADFIKASARTSRT